jgi:heme/copper-type cytochrome/quinol oxidase subunit 3
MTWPPGAELFGWQGAVAGTALLAGASFGLRKIGVRPQLAVLCGVLFLAVEAFEWSSALGAGITPRSSVFAGLFFTITGVHALHVFAGVAAMLWSNVNRRLLMYYWWLVDLVWIGIVVAFHI